jgi:uncharacterized protein with ParB-like and HNH nuclease domain
MFIRKNFDKKSTYRTIGFIKLGIEDGQFIFDSDVQRKYVWGEDEQQSLLHSLSHGLPLGAIALIDTGTTNNAHLEIVDGKQRITTLGMFFNNEIAYKCPYSNESMYFKDLPLDEQRLIKNSMTILVDELSPNTTLLQKYQYFYAINFSGKPQSIEHKEFIISKINDLK